jgi:ketosteroid isomerase-like protein
MSQQNLSIGTVQAWFEAFTDDTNAFRDTLHPDIEWFPFEDNHSPSFGTDAAMRIRQHWLDSWQEQVVDLQGIAVRGDNVVVTAHITARGKGSGVEVDTRLHFHFGLRDGRIVHIYEHLDRAEALEAAGLSEQDAPADS